MMFVDTQPHLLSRRMLVEFALLVLLVAVNAGGRPVIKRPNVVHHQNILRCKASMETVKFMWDLDTHTNISDWYTITNIKNDAPSRLNSTDARNKNKRIYSIEEQFGLNMDVQYNESVYRVKPTSEWLRNNDFTSPKFKLSFFDKYYDVNRPDGFRLATFKNVLVNNYGVIVDPDVCNRHMQIGGCVTGHGKVFKFETKPEMHDLVIALGTGASGTWHFPMEMLVALRNVPIDMLSEAIIHVPPRTAYMTNWLMLIPGVKESNIKDTAVIAAKTLLVPEMGFCAFPAPIHLDWLAHAVVLPPEPPYLGIPNPNALADNNKNLILVQRSHASRKVANKEEVHDIVSAFATEHGYNFVLQDDKKLPPLHEQITRFKKSDIVVMPHGAGGVFINFSPERACVMEFLPANGWNTCYARIAYIRNLNYISHMMVNGSIIDPDQLKDGLKSCVEVNKTPKKKGHK